MAAAGGGWGGEPPVQYHMSDDEEDKAFYARADRPRSPTSPVYSYSPTVPDAGAADDMVDDDDDEEEDMVDAAGYYSSESYDEAWPEPSCVYEDDPPDPAGAQRQAERYAESTRCTTTTRTRATRSSTSSSRPPTATASSSATPTSTSSLGRAAAARSACSSPRCTISWRGTPWSRPASGPSIRRTTASAASPASRGKIMPALMRPSTASRATMPSSTQRTGLATKQATRICTGLEDSESHFFSVEKSTMRTFE
nr:putative protein TPRXL [Setaria viridis]